jgi:hypothetical protein
MKRNRFTDEQIIGILKEHEAGNASVGALPFNVVRDVGKGVEMKGLYGLERI